MTRTASWFVTGTDTGVGKTVVSALALDAWRQPGLERGYFKPVQTGTDEDTPEVIRLAGLSPDEYLEPLYRFPEPISPHRAARTHGAEIQVPLLVARLHDAMRHAPGRQWIVEGAGGLLTPISTHETFAELALALQAELGTRLLVVSSTRLGTINQTLLTLEAARSRGLCVAGIVLVGPRDPGLAETLTEIGETEILAEIPWLETGADGKPDPARLRGLGREFLGRLPEFQPDGRTTLGERDERVLWHPYSQHGLHESILPISSGRGALLRLEDGREVIDGISSWWVNLHGHSHPAIARAIAGQARRLEHALFAGFTHEPGVRLAELLSGAFRERGRALCRVFYSDNGSTAVEVALKMAFQFHHQSDRQNVPSEPRDRFLALRGSYHGDTLGAMAVGDPGGYHTIFRPLLPQVDFIEPSEAGLEELRALFGRAGDRYAAFIFEPLLQGAGGMRGIPVPFLEEATRLCRDAGLLLIADEVFTGFGRTGRTFAIEHTSIQPDFVCLSKGITGGFLPLAATLTTEGIFEAFVSREVRQAFLHGHSYTANPVACAAAVASWELLQDPSCQERIGQISARTVEWIERLATLPGVADARSVGTVGALTLRQDGDYFTLPRERIVQASLERGVLLRPMGNVLYAVPPYCVSNEQLDRIYGTMAAIVTENIL